MDSNTFKGDEILFESGDWRILKEKGSNRIVVLYWLLHLCNMDTKGLYYHHCETVSKCRACNTPTPEDIQTLFELLVR